MNRCLDCQFLATQEIIHRSVDEIDPKPWKPEERRKGYPEFPTFEKMCAQGVWSTRIDPNLDVGRELQKDRGDRCYFLRVHEGMSFPAARDLLARRAEVDRSKRERRTLWLAGAAFVVSIVAVFRSFVS